MRFKEIISVIKNIFVKKSNLKESNPEIGFFSEEQKLQIENVVSFKIENWNFFEQAFSHRSVIADENILSSTDNQRLEYLGDALLGSIVADYLFHNYTDWKEGELTKLRSVFVKNSTLAHCGLELGINEFLIYGSHAEKNLHKGYESIVSDLVEALIAAIYLEKGFEKAKEFVVKKLIPIMTGFEDKVDKNYKSLLLEKCQELLQTQPKYTVIEENGPDHNKEFFVAVIVNNKIIAQGIGKTKKAAEQEAAKLALEKEIINF